MNAIDFLNRDGTIYWTNNVLPFIKQRIYGFEVDGEEKIKFECYSDDGFPIISSFYDNDLTPKFIALVKLTLTQIVDMKLWEHVSESDIQSVKKIKDFYKDSQSTVTQILFMQVDNDIQILDKTHLEV